MYKNKVMAGFFVFLFLLGYFVMPSFGEANNDALMLQKIDSNLLNSQGETSVIIDFSKKPDNYKQFIRSLGGRIVHDYGSLDSVAVKLEGKNISKLVNLENLIKVHEDKKVKALLHDSAPLISADQVWNQGITGKDVKVCVIDTGVDYRHPALGSCSPLIMNGNVEPYKLESPHPYPVSYNHEWTITKPGYTSIAVHFVNISLDNGYDFVYVKDATGKTVQSFTGELKDVWSVSVPGDTIKINLVSDWYLSLYGFYIDNVINGSVSFGFYNCKKVIAGYDFVNNDNDPMDDNDHGTHVTGIISSDDAYSRGIANGTKIMAAKVLDANGNGYESDVIAGIDWCLNNSAQIISMSLGGDEYNGTCDDDAVAEAVNDANDKGAVVVVAAGNSGQYGLTTPACASKAIAVGATDKNKSVVGFSSKGSELDIVAPGYEINSTFPNNGWYKMSGTSMAAPHVSGVIALMLEANPGLSNADIKNILSSTSDPANKCYECEWQNGDCKNYYGTEIPCTVNATGYGIVNAFRAVNYILYTNPTYYNIIEPADPSLYSFPASYKFSSNWLGNIDKVTLEFGGTNYTDLEKSGNAYSRTFNDLPVGVFYYKWYANDTSSNWNSTDMLSFTVSKASRTCSLTTDKGWTRTYDGTSSSTACGVSAGSSDGTMAFTMNSNVISTPDSRPSAGSYNYVCQWTGGVNYSDCIQTNTLTISKAVPSISLTISPSETIVYPTQTTVSCSISSMSNEVVPHLFRNGILVSNPDIATLSAGNYVYICNSTATQNYSAIQSQKTLVVNAASPFIITIQSPQNTSYDANITWANITLNKAGSWCGRSLDGRANYSMTNSSGNWNSQMTTLANGAHAITFYCNDTSGNMVSNATQFFYCYGDVNGDRTVNMRDVALLIQNFNYNCGNPKYNATFDLNSDCSINMKDVSIGIQNFNTICK